MQLPENASIEQGPALLGLLDQALAESTDTLTLEAGALRQFDTATLALLLEAQRRARVLGRVLEVRGAPPKLLELARLYGVEELLPLAIVPAASATPP